LFFEKLARRFDIRRYHFQERKMTNLKKVDKLYVNKYS